MHHAKPAKAWFAEHADATQVFNLPSYSLELSPDRMAIADIKQAITTLAPARTKPLLLKATARHLRSVQRQPSEFESALSTDRFAMQLDSISMMPDP